jgi:hypothetical protein
VITSDGKNVVEDVWAVLDKIKAFSDKVRNGEWVGGQLVELVCLRCICSTAQNLAQFSP